MISVRPFAFFALVVCAPLTGAHVFEITDVDVLLEETRYRIDVTVDVDALALGVSPAMDSVEIVAALERLAPEEFERAVERAKGTASRRTRVRFDDVKQRPEISFPADRIAFDDEGSPVPSILGITARLEGDIPQGAEIFRFGLSRSFGESRLVIRTPRSDIETVHLLAVGEDSPAFSLSELPTIPGAGTTLVRYTKLGFLHIVPRGADHVLFVLGLFLMARGIGDLLIRISAFTLAHTFTLGLSAAGYVVVPGSWVEPLIALSIAWIALENILAKSWNLWRTGVVFSFGLLHGLGFAGVLGELGLPQGRFLPALLGFNVGVELGQLSVVLVAWVLLHRFREHPAYRTRVVIPLSAVIGGTGLFWAIQRVFF